MEDTGRKKKRIVMIGSIIAFVICLTATIILNRRMAGQDIDESEIENVECRVTRVESHSVRVNGQKITNYEYYGSYLGKEYKIHNVIEKYKFKEGSMAKVLLYKGKLYANMEGIKTSTGLATVYFVFLFGTVGVFAFMINAMVKYFQNKGKTA